MYKNGLGIEVDMDKAIDYFQRSAELGNRNAKRILALEYISGEHMEQNIEKGLAMLGNIEQFENAVLANTIFGMFINLSRCIEDDYAQKYKSVKRIVDSRLRRMISQKKQSIGMKEDFTQSLD